MIIAGFSLFVIGLIFIIAYPINKKKNARCTAHVQGVLSDIRARYDSDGRLKDRHVYSYQVNGTEYRLETIEHSLEANNIGDSCTIWYNPKKPEDAQAFQGSDKYLKTLLTIGLLLVLAGLALTVVGLSHL